MSADQFLAALWRRKLLVGAVAGAVFALGAGIVLIQPKLYTATSVVRVEPQRPGEEMVQRTVSDIVEQRLLTVRQELLARPVLQRAIEEMGLYPEVVVRKGIDAAVEAMRADLTVRVEGESAFELTYQSTEPRLAAAVANRLPQLYSEEAVRMRKRHAQRATALFGEELEQLKQEVSRQERDIAQFKVAHMGELPEQLESNMRGLERISGLIATKSDQLRAAETRRSDLVRSRYAADTEAGRLKAAEDGLTRALVAAQVTWTKDHPEVQRIEKELDSVVSRRLGAERMMVVEQRERARAASVVEDIKAELASLEAQAQGYQRRLDNTPNSAHELAVMSRDYEIARTKYQSLVSRRVEAELAEELEAKSAKTLFNVVSPAAPPVDPAKPDRMGGLLIALLAALGVGVLVAVVMEMRDETIREPAELTQRMTMPVLAVVPQMTEARTSRRVLSPAAGRSFTHTSS